MITLTTERLTVRNFRSEDWQDLQEVITNYQASEWAKYEDSWPTSDVSLKSENKVIGFVAINRRDDREEPTHNLGYIFNPELSGQGYATESCQACVEYVFGCLKAVSIVTGTHPDNEPSVRLLTRLGLHAMENGEYTLTREEWLTKKKETT